MIQNIPEKRGEAICVDFSYFGKYALRKTDSNKKILLFLSTNYCTNLLLITMLNKTKIIHRKVLIKVEVKIKKLKY